MNRASRSLPTPLSPTIRTVESTAATRDARPTSSRHRRAVHTETDFAIGNGPLGVWVWHRPLNDTGRHRTGSEAVFSRRSICVITWRLDKAGESLVVQSCPRERVSARAGPIMSKQVVVLCFFKESCRSPTSQSRTAALLTRFLAQPAHLSLEVTALSGARDVPELSKD